MQRSTAILSMLLAFGLMLIAIRLIQPVTPALTPGPTAIVRATSTAAPKGRVTLPLIITGPGATSTPKPKATPTSTPKPGAVKVHESFETIPSSWQVARDIAGNGSVDRSNLHVAAGSYAARITTTSSGERAALRTNFSDPSTSHTWNERPGTWHWQQTSLYLPSTTITKLSPGEYITLAGMYPSTGGSFGWFLRLKQGRELYVFGYTSDGKPQEFRIYSTFPQDSWVELEIGLHTQLGPGVKRSFAFLINGAFYGWYRQGSMQTETFDRTAIGILDTNHTGALELFVDQWRTPTTANLPGGPDQRSTARLQEQNFRDLSGIQVQYDWSTWQFAPALHAQYGLYSTLNRLQAGRNIDRMPDLNEGWAEIEIDWPKGQPPTNPSSYFGPMVGFRKEIAREENLEIIPIGAGDGQVQLAFEAWVGKPVILATWPLPVASIGGGSHIPEPGDIIRVRWQQVDSTRLNVQASYYDSSAAHWSTNSINGTFNISSVSDGTNTVNYSDGSHKAASVTIDSPYYSIRRFKLGTLDTYPSQ